MKKNSSKEIQLKTISAPDENEKNLGFKVTISFFLVATRSTRNVVQHKNIFVSSSFGY